MTDDKSRPDAVDHVGQAAGGITGVLAGAAVGTAAGPIGVLLGGIAGAIGGWWSGRAIAEAAEDITEADESYYRAHVRSVSRAPDDDPEVKGAFYLGHIAAANPNYQSRPFDDIEKELERGWRATRSTSAEWKDVRDCCCAGFTRGRERRSRPRPS